MKKSMCVLGVILLAGCSSTKINGNVYEKDEVLSTLDGSSQPDWANESKPFYVSSGKAYSVGVTTLYGNERPEAGMRISENNARSNFAKTIENRMEFVFQNSEENAGMDSSQARYIGSEFSSLTSHSMTVEGNWYKRYAQSNDDGSRRIMYKIYSLVSMPESDMKRAVDDAIAGRVQKKALSDSFQAKVDTQWDRFVEGKTNLSQVKQKDVQLDKQQEPTTKTTVVSEAVVKDGE